MNKASLLGLLLAVGSVTAQALEMGEAVPSYRIPLQRGGEVTADTQKQHVTLLHFWASWCVPCRAEMPRLDALYQRFHGQGLDIVAINMDQPQDRPAAKSMMSHYHFPWALAQQSDYAGFGRIWRLPLSVLIDRQGKVRQNAWAADDDHGLSQAQLMAQVVPLMAMKQASGTPSTPLATVPPPTILHAYARATAPGQTVGVVYLTLRNEGDTPDALEGADSLIADHIMLHQTQAMAGGMSHMQHEYHLVIPAHGQVDLSPGGHHLMLEDISQPLVAGQVIPLNLHLQRAGTIHVDVPVMPLVPE